MSFVLPFAQLSKDHVSIAGGKGAQLGEMTSAGIPVPPGFVVLTASFEEMIEENNLKNTIKEILKSVDPKKTETVNQASEQIRHIISKAHVPKNVDHEIYSAFDSLGAEFVAVRSSATAEDASTASWAGELETYLNIQRDGLVSAVKKCWSSLFTPRAIFYRFEKGMAHLDISVAVVVQKMVQSEVSGVAFTVHPVTKDANQMVIEAGWGLGEAVVGGLITPDNYVVDKSEELILDVTVNAQEYMIAKDKTGKTHEVPVPEEKREKQKLDGRTIMALATLFAKIEKHYGKPQDIEWAWEQGQTYVVQTRPITTL